MKPHHEIPENYCMELQELLRSTPFGAVCELGVFKGGSAWYLHEADNSRPLHLFDTFTGIPHQLPGDAFSVGHFSNTSVDEVRACFPNAFFHVGVFPDTWPPELKDVSFVHVDCDQGSTCREAIAKFWPVMLPGGIMAFDDYNFHGMKQAINEFFGSELKFTFLNIPYAVKP